MYYAALDAFVGLELYERLHQLAEEKGIPSDRFSSTFLPFKHLLNVKATQDFTFLISIVIFDAQVDEGADWTPH